MLDTGKQLSFILFIHYRREWKCSSFGGVALAIRPNARGRLLASRRSNTHKNIYELGLLSILFNRQHPAPQNHRSRLRLNYSRLSRTHRIVPILFATIIINIIVESSEDISGISYVTSRGLNKDTNKMRARDAGESIDRVHISSENPATLYGHTEWSDGGEL